MTDNNKQQPPAANTGPSTRVNHLGEFEVSFEGFKASPAGKPVHKGPNEQDQGDYTVKVKPSADVVKLVSNRLNKSEQAQAQDASLPVSAIEDLLKSGLTPEDMKVRVLTAAERGMCNLGMASEGYIIPYYNSIGRPIPFYRVKITTPELENGFKYRQPRKTSNHIYFPPGLRTCLDKWIQVNGDFRVLLITEGEKKAACAVAQGIPCVGLGGVDSWRSKTIVLPSDAELYQSGGRGARKALHAKLPSSDISVPELAQLAQGFGDMIDLIVKLGLIPIVVYDSDEYGTIKSEVQRAAAMLGYEMRFLGVPAQRIKQIILPDLHPGQPIESKSKVGIDDFLMDENQGLKGMLGLIASVVNNPAAFPKHPNPKGYINAQMRDHHDRKMAQQVASVILSELDAKGIRLKDKYSGDPYYYDRMTHKLIRANLQSNPAAGLHLSDLGSMLFKEFGLTGNDKQVLGVLASSYVSEEPILTVTPHRIVARITEREDPKNADGIAFQVSDSHFIAVSGDPKQPIEYLTNGSKGILFEQHQSEAFDVDKMLNYFDEFNSELRPDQPLECWWLDVIKQSNISLVKKSDLAAITNEAARERILRDSLHQKIYAALLFYVSPYLQRWRGTQMPVELMIGEPGSGKSSLFMLRSQIMTGQMTLRNMPNDIRDWYASITSLGGLHVIDNVHFTKNDLRQRMSDEICRLVTEPEPSVEMRKLFTTADSVKIPVTATFALTALQMPFVNADLIQRAAIFEAKPSGQRPEGNWVERQLEERGGREAWIAHQLLFLHRFLRTAVYEDKWQSNFPTDHRLVNLEQCLHIASQVFGISVKDSKLIGASMLHSQYRQMQETDYIMQGIKEYLECGELKPRQKFDVRDISSWAAASEDYADIEGLINTRRLGRYLQLNSNMLFKTCRIRPVASTNNRATYIVDESAPKMTS